MIYSQSESEIIFSNSIENEIVELVKTHKRLFVLTDTNTVKYCYPEIEKSLPANTPVCTIPAGEDFKNIETVSTVWDFLNKNRADRKSVLINLGGGVVCDLGGFAASTFKRGIDFIQIPTTLLSQVDASVGGKTGINFNNYKNEIGCFSFPLKVIIYAGFIKTLDQENILSGFGEMIKHAFIHDENYFEELKKLELNKEKIEYDKLLNLIKKSVKIKEEVVLADPMEKGLRKILNFGHTIGHAFESYYMGTDHEIIHGKAVAYGLVIELYLSNLKSSFPEKKLTESVDYINKTFGKVSFSKNDYERLYELMTHDKKNESELVNFSFIEDFGKPVINKTASKSEIFRAFDYYLGT